MWQTISDIFLTFLVLFGILVAIAIYGIRKNKKD